MVPALSLLLHLRRLWISPARRETNRRLSICRKYFLACVLLSLLVAPLFAQTRPALLCRQIVLEGEAKQGVEWQAGIGHAATSSGATEQNWIIRLVPIHSGGTPGIAAAHTASPGWDLAVSPVKDQDYPDALLLASPPYGSLNSREIATTFGLRAQDAIAWSPRHFHFFTSAGTFARARRLYRALLDPNPAPSAFARRQASAQLLDLSTQSPDLAAGRIETLDAHLVSGSGDPAPYAAQWAASFLRISHTLDPGGENSPRQGELHSFRFRITLWLPASWKAPPGTGTRPAKCAE
jgi:hypothetical protein